MPIRRLLGSLLLLVISGFAMPLIISTPPTFKDAPDACYASNIPLTTKRAVWLNRNAKYGAVRNECIYMGFFANGNVVPLPVSPVDGYTYSQAEVQYRARLTCPRPPSGGFTPGQKTRPGVAASSAPTGGWVYYSYHNVDDASGLVNTITSYWNGSHEAVTSDGVVKVYATCQRADVSMQAGVPVAPQNYVPALVNPPIFIEPIDGLIQGLGDQFYLLICVSDSDSNYGGCVAYWSTDNGATFQALDDIQGNCVTGQLTADWPASADPDTTNDLSVSTAESNNGLLAAVTVAGRDNFVTPIYIGGGVSPIPYELMAYSALTGSAGAYVLKATGGGTNELRRAVLGAPQVGQGCDHPKGAAITVSGAANNGSGLVRLTVTSTSTLASFNQVYVAAVVGTGGLPAYINNQYWTVLVVDGTHIDLVGSVFVGAYTSGGTIQALSRFAQLVTPGTGPGQLLIPIPENLIGKQILFKFSGFNALGRGFQPLSSLVTYSYTTEGLGSDTGLPYSPIGGQTAGVGAEIFGNGQVIPLLEVNYPVTPANNLDSVNTEAISFGYIDETNVVSVSLLGNVDNTSNPVSVNVSDSTKFVIGQTYIIGTDDELLQVIAIPDGTHVISSRSLGGSSIVAHTSGALVFPLVQKNFSYSYGVGQYVASLSVVGLSTSATVSHNLYFPNARLYWTKGSLSNGYGTVSTLAWMGDVNGVQTGFGETDTLAVSQPTNQVVAAGVNVLTPVHSPNAATMIPVSITAYLADAASGTSITVTLNVNGSAYTTLTITTGNTSSTPVTGTILATLAPIPANAQMTADVALSVPTATYTGDGLRVVVVF